MRRNKKTRNMISAVLIVVALLLIAGCGVYFFLNRDGAAQAEETTQKGAAEADAQAPEEAAEEVQLTEKELAEFEELFNTDEYNGFVIHAFPDSSYINWEEVVFNGAGINKSKVSDEERADYLEMMGQDELYTDLLAIDREDLAKYMQDKAGVDLNDLSEDEFGWAYSDKYDCYYAEHCDTNFLPCYCVEGTRRGDTYQLDFVADNPIMQGSFVTNPDRILTVKDTNNGYTIISNVINWESGNNKEQTFDVELPQLGDRQCRLISWDGNVDDQVDARMMLAVDGDYYTSMTLGTDDDFDDTHIHMETIAAIGVFDFNADGYKDIAVVGKDWSDKDVLIMYLCTSSYDDNYYFMMLPEVSAKVQSMVTGELNIPNVKAALLGSDQVETYDTWQEAYRQTAYMAHLEMDSNVFSLVYIDEDDVPELVVDNTGYMVSIYKYKDGISYPVAEGWGYGAMGNHGYEYAEKKNCLRNYNTDYAGAILYTSYMSIQDDGAVMTDFCEKFLNFDDLDGDGIPSDEEMERTVSGDYTGSSEYMSDTGYSDDEVKKHISEIESTYEFLPLGGDLEYDAFVQQLGGN